MFREVSGACGLPRSGFFRKRFNPDGETGTGNAEADEFSLHSPGKRFRGCLAGGVERCRPLPVAGGRRHRRGYRAAAFLGLIREFGERGPNLPRPLEQGVRAARCSGVAALETAQHGEAVLDFREPLRRRPDAVAPVPHRRRQVLHLDQQVRTSVEQPRGPGVHGARLLESAQRDRQLGPGRGVRSVEGLIRTFEAAGELFRVAERPPLFEEAPDLAWLRRRPFDLFEGPLHLGAPSRRGGQPFTKSVAFRFASAKGAESGRHVAAQGRVTTRLVHRVPGGPWLKEGQVLPLAVDLGEDHPQRPKHGNRHRGPVHGDPIGDRAPSRREPQLPPDHEIAVFGGESRFPGQRPESLPVRRFLAGRRETRLDNRAVPQGPHEL